MSTTGTQISTIGREVFVPARNLAQDAVPWVPLSAGKSSIWNAKGSLVGQLDDRSEGLLIIDTNHTSSA